MQFSLQCCLLTTRRVKRALPSSWYHQRHIVARRPYIISTELADMLSEHQSPSGHAIRRDRLLRAGAWLNAEALWSASVHCRPHSRVRAERALRAAMLLCTGRSISGLLLLSISHTHCFILAITNDWCRLFRWPSSLFTLLSIQSEKYRYDLKLSADLIITRRFAAFSHLLRA